MVTIEHIINTLIDKARQKEGMVKIRSRFGKDFERPDMIKVKGRKKQIAPDLTITFRNRTDLYIVEQESTYDLEKWRLLSLYAMKMQGILNILAPRDYEARISRKLEEAGIRARIIFLEEQ